MGVNQRTEKRMGRPTANPKKRMLVIRLSDSESELLEACVKKTGLSQTGVVLKGLALVLKQR